MRFTKFRLPLVLSVLFIKTLFAQNNLSEGYYIDLKRDTIHGFFNFDDLFVNKVLFYANKTTSTSKVLVPEGIKHIETLDNIFITSFLYAFKDQKEPLFLSKFADGNVQLYRGKSFNADEGEVFFISSVKIPEIKKITRSNPKIFLNKSKCRLISQIDF